MSTLHTPESGSCSDGCQSCPIASTAAATPGPFAGTALGFVSLGYFIFPIVVAFCSSLLFRGNINAQALAGFAGLFGGVLLTVMFARRFTRRYERARTVAHHARAVQRAARASAKTEDHR